MRNSVKRYRVPVEFPEDERNLLDLLCTADLRQAAEQIRWLVLTEAKRRGMASSLLMENRAGGLGTFTSADEV